MMVSEEDELFRSCGYMPELKGLSWLELPAIIRVLLATDGTVTKSLESYFWEPINVRCVQQKKLTPAEHQGAVASGVWQANDELWGRDVCLEGEVSQKSYVSASSVVCFSVLPAKLRQGLLVGELGIGEIIRSLGMETYRQVVRVGQSPELPQKAKLAWRVYHLYYQGRILIKIKEEFSLKAFC